MLEFRHPGEKRKKEEEREKVNQQYITRIIRNDVAGRSVKFYRQIQLKTNFYRKLLVILKDLEVIEVQTFNWN